MQQTRKRPGRPARELQPGERVPMSFRVTPELKGRMDAAAASSGRSVTQELEFLIEQAMLFRDLLGTGLHPMLQVISEFRRAGDAFAQERGITGDWTENPDAYGFALAYTVGRLVELYPGPWNEDAVRAMLAGGFDMGRMKRLKALGNQVVLKEPEESDPAATNAAAHATTC